MSRKLCYIVTEIRNGKPRTASVTGNMLGAYTDAEDLIRLNAKVTAGASMNYNKMCYEFRKNNTAELVLFDNSGYKITISGKYFNERAIAGRNNDDDGQLAVA